MAVKDCYLLRIFVLVMLHGFFGLQMEQVKVVCYNVTCRSHTGPEAVMHPIYLLISVPYKLFD